MKEKQSTPQRSRMDRLFYFEIIHSFPFEFFRFCTMNMKLMVMMSAKTAKTFNTNQHDIGMSSQTESNFFRCYITSTVWLLYRNKIRNASKHINSAFFQSNEYEGNSWDQERSKTNMYKIHEEYVWAGHS